MAEESSLVRLQDEWDIELDWRGFELHPDTPEGGIAIADYFGPERIPMMRRHLLGFAAQAGVAGMRFNERMVNSRRALALAELAREQGRLHPYRRAAASAWWREGLDLEDDRVLADLATRAGMDGMNAVDASKDPVYLQRVDAMQAEARRAGIRGIPTVQVGGLRVVGAQPYEVFAQAALQAGAQRRDGSRRPAE